MLATFVIGLREGLEAALIVGIIAAFLRKNGKSLAAMWWGVALAVLLSIAVGVSLDVIEQALPQASQEGMESVIGAIAIFFVTGMIAWMNKHARNLKREIETQAAEALSQASAFALAAMAFLAVLKEGFETSVFLLATFSAAQSAVLAATGAVLGVVLAVVIGWGIYVGGVRINLARFFQITGAFLILVAAGLVMTALRTAHEAGWLNAGQQATVSLSWLVAPGTIQSALITGVLGIPADPRLIEMLGWFAYLIPVALFVYWPQSRRPSAQGAIRLHFVIAVALLVAAATLATAIPKPRARLSMPATIVTGEGSDPRAVGVAHLITGSGGSLAMLEVAVQSADHLSLPLPKSGGRYDQHDSLDATTWSFDLTGAPAGAPATLTLDQVVALSGGRIPLGLNPHLHPGPFAATWSRDRSIQVWTVDALLLDATQDTTTVVALSGSGLATPRILTVDDASSPAANWQISAAYRERVAATLNTLAAARMERVFWVVQLPILLVLIAALLALLACRRWSRLRQAPAAGRPLAILDIGDRAARSPKGTPHAAD